MSTVNKMTPDCIYSKQEQHIMTMEDFLSGGKAVSSDTNRLERNPMKAVTGDTFDESL